jgi:hypothetical protein
MQPVAAAERRVCDGDAVDGDVGNAHPRTLPRSRGGVRADSCRAGADRAAVREEISARGVQCSGTKCVRTEDGGIPCCCSAPCVHRHAIRARRATARRTPTIVPPRLSLAPYQAADDQTFSDLSPSQPRCHNLGTN